MASNNQTSGRTNPIISNLLLTSANANEGKYTFNKLKFAEYLLDNPSYFKGQIAAIPLAQQFGDGRVVGTGVLKRNVGGSYVDVSRERTFDTTDFECVERAPVTYIDQLEIDRTGDDRIALLNMKNSRTLQLTSAIFDDFEYDLLAAVFNTSSFSNATVAGLTGGIGTAWNAAGSSPAKDGVAVQNLMRARGAKVDYAVISFDVLQTLRSHPETLGVWYKTSGATNAPPVLDADATLQYWAQKWGLSKGVHVAETMYNSANPASTASLSEFVSGKVAFHCADGLSNSYNIGGNITANGLVSLAIVRESQYRGYEDPTTNPHGLQLTAKHSYALVTPYASAAYRPAYILTSVNG